MKNILRSLIILIILTTNLFGNHFPLENKKILFLGDSITQNGTYVSIIQYYLESLFPQKSFDIKSIGLSSETASCLSEPSSQFPRPCVHERLERALEEIKPDIVVACYGMNDGIYHPQNPERFKAFQNGIMKLIEKSKTSGAEFIILTPPVFDPVPIKNKIQPDGLSEYGYAKPYYKYGEVLQDFSKWIITLNIDNVKTIDINTPMTDYLNEKRKTDSLFTLSPDGVHPSSSGHLFMAQEFLKALDFPVEVSDLDSDLEKITADSLYSLINNFRQTRSDGWLKFIGYTKGGTTVKIDTIEPTENKVSEIRNEIEKYKRNRK